MKRVRLVHDERLAYLTITDVKSGEEMSVALDSKEAEELGEGLFRAGRAIEAHAEVD